MNALLDYMTAILYRSGVAGAFTETPLARIFVA